MLSFGLLLIASYLLGSIPTSYLLGRWLKGIDIRDHGSGNVGSTNAYRTLGARPAIFTVVADILKGFIPVFFFTFYWKGWGQEIDIPYVWVQISFGICAIIGHIRTIFLKFRGGKGVATGAGVILGLTPIPALIALTLFIALVAGTGYVSLGSIVAALSIPIVLVAGKFSVAPQIEWELISLGVVLAITVLVTHRSNIGRFLRKEEKRIWNKT
ncbi:MAG: acyl-phosphate glycerol 3-phosphate acyltransferase [Candidatus Cloacimonetes bacterium 4572_55]|nr:MAG: acyl-phosphate glycerol 3-phosphate acyltransferase [Candidatus Cloacimonetes bacterium 4572_55]